MVELSDDERGYLAAFSGEYTPSAEATAAAFASVEARIASGEVVSLEPDAPPRGRRGVVVLALTAIAVAAAVLLVARTDLASTLLSEASPSSSEEAAYSEVTEAHGADAATRTRQTAEAPRARPPEPSPPTDEPAAELVPPATEETEKTEAPPPVVEAPLAETEREPKPKPAPRTKAVPKPEPEPEAPADAADATLHAELALLRPAHQALRAGNHARALKLLDDHARAFPDSPLSPERSYARIQALCGLGRTQAARDEIAAFGRAHPGSPLAGRVKAACPVEETP